MTDPSALAAMSRAELLDLARERAVVGRWGMTKPQLVEALSDGGASPAGSVPGEITVRQVRAAPVAKPPGRRARLAERLAAVVDPDRRCEWRSEGGSPCGLPPVVDRAACALHGGVDVFDRAVAVTGRLGFDTWPTLIRHLAGATYDVDPVGLDPVVLEMVWHLVNFLYFDYFKVEVDGAEHVPPGGPAMVVGNHGGGLLPYDGALLTAACANEPDTGRRLRVIGTEIFNMLPWVSHLYRKVGAAYATRGDVAHLLGAGRLVGVFPEGERGFMKPPEEAYRVQRLGRGGFVELAEQHGAPIVPVAIVGAEEVHPAVATSETLARLVRLVFPQQRVDEVAVVLNPIPLPVRWHIRFLPPLSPVGGGATDDPLWVLERSEAVRSTLQGALDTMVADRR